MLKAISWEDEINQIVFGFPKEKSPSRDGVTYEFIQDSWSFVSEGCIAMIQAFWEDAQLSSNMVKGIIKMVPKGFEMLENLDYWRNLTMLTTSYKIISKILTERLKPMVPHLVDRQQTRFVKDRCITDNLLAWKLGQEHAQAMLQDIMFVKLDFAKAYDRIDHSFLWATLTTMCMDPFFIKLIQGLVLNVEAKVHINGLFTHSFPLERGVRQGDLLSPFLFVLSSEPLIRLLEDMRRGELTGLRINQDLNLLY